MEQLTSIRATLGRLEPAKLVGLAAATLGVLLLIAWVSFRSAEPMGLLYAGLDPAEAGRIGQRLDEMKVPFEARGDGTTIMVPASQVARARMELAAAGMPHQEGAGYELLDSQSPMNMTSFMQRVQRLRALEGELSRSIVALDGVKVARVHIVLPERESFARDTLKPTASIGVVMGGAMRLSRRQAMAIRLLVSGAVPGLKQEDVSVLDPSGAVLAADDADGAASSRLDDMKTSREQALQHSVDDLLEPLVGRGHVRTAVSVEINDSREVTREEKFDPQSQVERSKQIQADSDTTEEVKPQEAVTVTQNIPPQPQQPGGTGAPHAHQRPGSIRRRGVTVSPPEQQPPRRDQRGHPQPRGEPPIRHDGHEHGCDQARIHQGHDDRPRDLLERHPDAFGVDPRVIVHAKAAGTLAQSSSGNHPGAGRDTAREQREPITTLAAESRK